MLVFGYDPGGKSANGVALIDYSKGKAMAIRLRSTWSNLELNKAHPKVLYFRMTGKQYNFGQPMIDWLVNQLNPLTEATIGNEHEWDALLAAWATLRGLTGTSPQNLMQKANNLLLSAGAVKYYWP